MIKTFWTGKNGPIWTAYFDTTLSVDFIPDNNEITKLICQQQLNITSGNGGILVPYNNTYLFCPAQQTDTHLPLCEAKALDSFDNKALCHGPYINADQRPQQYGVSCSTILENLWLDIILVVDVSKHISVNELDELSKSFMDSFDALNLNVNSQHSSRIALITYATLAKVQMKFGEITNVTQLQKKLSLEKYRNPFDGNRNAKSAFLLAKTLLLLNQSHRRSVVIFVSSGFKSTQNPAPIANILKSLFNTNIITVSTSSDSQNIDNISTYGFNLALNDQFSQSFQFSLSQSNCYCPSNYQQFIFTDPTTKKVTYFAECIFGSNAQKTVNEAFDICSQQKATPIIVTSQAKAAFLIRVKRHYQNINVHMWHEYMQDGYSMGTYPPKLIQFDDLSMNCSMGIIVGETVASLPIDCNKAKLPYICQKQAFDGDHL
uniref:VWFA domain-containing protein n=1 Tax=Panagrolaimus superbus TaxID=310955 RepID=A0A914YIL7_9BILA